ncbi:hypothetical protein TanjilG_15060 [Lupinus angustifolius]|uniref:Uncharacterized protein n=1 Tax=Lupinus angustifolius TaxID=3871 RepID=A0A1J7GZZ0_LUPAN|nr:hypothetical protein TanjilG_15060 [Lupinus angustifolius]
MQLDRAKAKIDRVKFKVHRATPPHDRGKINLDRGIMVRDRRNEKSMQDNALPSTHQSKALHNTLTVAHRPWHIDSDRGSLASAHPTWAQHI